MSPKAELTCITLCALGGTAFAVLVRDAVGVAAAGATLVGVGAAWWALLRLERLL